MNALYNEIEPFAADWLEQLTVAGHIAPGRVERRSIADLTAADVAGHGQRHFFAGIGGWSYALRLAGVRDDADVWTGSCPCQPFSSAGKRGGTSDARHLWPAWFALIKECRPPVIFGEQVASDDGLGWLDAVSADLERLGYSVGAADLCAAQLAPHGRSRLFFVAYADDRSVGERLHVSQRKPRREVPDANRRGANGAMAASQLGDSDGLAGRRNARTVPRAEASDPSVRSRAHGSGATGADMDRRLADASNIRQQGGEQAGTAPRQPVRSGVASNPWADAIWIECLDGKRRLIPTEPALFPLAHGVPNRVGLLRGSGNAIVPQAAATFIKAALEARGEMK